MRAKHATEFQNLEDRLLEEFNRLRRLEPAIDDILGRR